MEVFRIARLPFANMLTASGAAGRWNLNGQEVIYTSNNRALATLEIIVRRKNIQPENEYLIMVIHLKDENNLYSYIKTKDLPFNWRDPEAYKLLQAIGSEWYQAQETLVLKVPSAIIPQEHNYIINTRHPDFERHVALIHTEPYFWDKRLL